MIFIKNIYQINKNGKNIVDYKTLVNERQAKGEASLNRSYLWFPVCMMIAFFAHLGLIIENNKEKNQKCNVKKRYIQTNYFYRYLFISVPAREKKFELIF